MNINTPLQGGALALPFTKAADPEKRGEVNRKDAALRLPYARRLPDSVRNHLVAMIGEYVGTVLFLFLALGGTQVANNIHTSSGQTQAEVGSNPQQLQYIALCFGFSLAVNAWVFFRISGGLFNPAVTFGMCLIGVLPYLRAVLLFFAQILGGVTAAALVSCMFPGPLAVGTALGGGTTIVQGLFIEMLLTAELVFAIFMLAAEKHKGTFMAPIGIGLALFIAELVGVYFTGGSLNPSRSFGPAVVNHHFVGYHWIYWLGPILGSIVAAGFYKLIKILEYETANPNQDAAAPEHRDHDHHHHASARSSYGSNTHTYGNLADRDQDTQAKQPAAVGSPGMGSQNDMNTGLANGGMHAGQEDKLANLPNSPGMGMGVGHDTVTRLGRGSSYAV
ncbi:Aquaporin-1 [Elasticomyces elasticus]|uniref:Aquaporin-1 n=1 Tax=Elasticomyces elasticus TaxID=574655 RepID=A0AAN7WHD7_9PEZI|nr:Aquaporin-1 [Elasticomyces elasticus]